MSDKIHQRVSEILAQKMAQAAYDHALAQAMYEDESRKRQMLESEQEQQAMPKEAKSDG